MKRLAAVILSSLVLSACGAQPQPFGAPRPAAAPEARLGKVTFTAKLDKETYVSTTAKNLPYPTLMVTGTPKLGSRVTATYVELFVGEKRLGNRYLFPGQDGALYAVVEIDEKTSHHVAYPTGTAYLKVGTYTKPAELTRGAAIAFTLAEGAHLERHSEFAVIRTDTWISLHQPKAEAVQSPPLILAADVR